MSMEDRAQQEEAFQWELINRPRPAAPRYKLTDSGCGPRFCSNESCGEPMPRLRRREGKKFCTECQGLIERRAKRGY
jgi:RNA polymerase-binding transcription factor DksA